MVKAIMHTIHGLIGRLDAGGAQPQQYQGRLNDVNHKAALALMRRPCARKGHPSTSHAPQNAKGIP